MRVRDLVEAMESIAPSRFAAPWDNVGLLVGDAAAELSRVLLAIDCTRPVAEEARRARCDAVVSYHPVLFEGQKKLLAGSIAYELARDGLAVYSPHTALDVAEGGTNDVLADVLGMTDRAPLRPVAGPARDGGPPLEARGFGRVGAVSHAPVRTIVESVKAGLGIGHVLVAGPLDRTVSRAAVCAGSGGDLLGEAIASGAHLFLTGELRHHDALTAAAAGLTAVCALHWASERCALARLERVLGEHLPGVSVTRSAADREPFAFA